MDNRLETTNPQAPPTAKAERLTLAEEVEALERQRIVEALNHHGRVQAKAARALGITPRQLGYKIRKYGIRLQ